MGECGKKTCRITVFQIPCGEWEFVWYPSVAEAGEEILTVAFWQEKGRIIVPSV
jgi:hypothetical protein